MSNRKGRGAERLERERAIRRAAYGDPPAGVVRDIPEPRPIREWWTEQPDEEDGPEHGCRVTLHRLQTYEPGYDHEARKQAARGAILPYFDHALGRWVRPAPEARRPDPVVPAAWWAHPSVRDDGPTSAKLPGVLAGTFVVLLIGLLVAGLAIRVGCAVIPVECW